MANKHKHTLEGLIRWSRREQWVDRFEQILAEHVLPTCNQTGLEVDGIVAILGEELFMSTVWACAFEDFLTREFDDGENAIDDYLKRRGWKESASVRAYIAALRNSAMSLYEVSDIVPGTSFRARDLIRGGEPVLIGERSATRTLKPWERIAARVVQVGPKMQIGGGVLPFEQETSKLFIEALDKFETLTSEEKQEFAEANGRDFDDAAFSKLSAAERLRAITPMFTTFWLVDAIERIQAPEPDWRNTEGDELVRCEVCYPLAAGTTGDDIRAALKGHAEFCLTDTTSWNWITWERPAATSPACEQPQRSLNFETWQEGGALVLGGVVLEDKAVVLSVNSRQRCENGRALLSEILGRYVEEPSVKTESVEQMMASGADAEPQKLDIPEEERLAIVHGELDQHYRRVLDEPVAVLGGKTPRAAVKSDGGRAEVAGWLKMMENRTAKSGDHDSAMASYSFSWLWAELGISELRR